jgi:hypothetical protein
MTIERGLKLPDRLDIVTFARQAESTARRRSDAHRPTVANAPLSSYRLAGQAFPNWRFWST